MTKRWVYIERSFNRWLEVLIIMEVGEPGKLHIYDFLAHKLGPLPFQQFNKDKGDLKRGERNNYK
jgi:hypothetical protein